MEALSTPDFTMATPNGVAAARQAVLRYALRALPRSFEGERLPMRFFRTLNEFA